MSNKGDLSHYFSETFYFGDIKKHTEILRTQCAIAGFTQDQTNLAINRCLKRIAKFYSVKVK